MSDFTCGNLILKKCENELRGRVLKDDYLLNLSDKWLCYLSKEDDSMGEKAIPEHLLELSKSFPILRINHAEDHGFDCVILNEGKVSSSFDVNYEMEYYIEINSLIECFGEDILDEFYAGATIKLPEEIIKRDSEKYEQMVHDMFLKVNYDDLKLFDLDDEKIVRLRDILKPECYKEHCFGMVMKFMEILEIERFEFTSWHYVNSDEEGYPIINNQ